MAVRRNRRTPLSHSKVEENYLVCSSTSNSKTACGCRHPEPRHVKKFPRRKETMSNQTLLFNRLAFIKANLSESCFNSCKVRFLHCNRISTENRYQEHYSEFYHYILLNCKLLPMVSSHEFLKRVNR